MKQHIPSDRLFSKAVAFVEFDQSGNPHEKYKPGTGLLDSYNREASKSGKYESYIDSILSETQSRFNELVTEINAYYSATFSKNPELKITESLHKLRLLREMDRN